MFSPATTKKSNLGARRNANGGGVAQLKNDDFSSHLDFISATPPTVPNRPATGTPAPWASRPSVLARTPPVKRGGHEDEADTAIQPVYVREFPQVVRDAQLTIPADASVSGGMDKDTRLAWVVFDGRLFIWNYFRAAASRKCVALDLPSTELGIENMDNGSFQRNNWLVRVINWDAYNKSGSSITEQLSSAGLLMCSKKTSTLIFWPDIYNPEGNPPRTCLVLSELEGSHMSKAGRAGSNRKLFSINSLIASAVPGSSNSCIALSCTSSGSLLQFFCNTSGIEVKQIESGMQGSDNSPVVPSKGYPRSLIWHSFQHPSEDSKRQFLLLTNHEIRCYKVKLSSDFEVSKLWEHEIVGSDSDLGIQKDLAGQKKIWPLDLDINSDGKVITILIAILCKDRVTTSSYTEYSLLTMQYKSGLDIANPIGERILEKKAPIQVIIPKARVEDDEFLFSMRLKIGGRPAGSAVILSGDGTATVSHWRNSTRLYQFDLPYDSGKVLDASVLPSSDEIEDGAWAVLTEKAGIWAIPEKAVLLGGVEPPERSLSRKGSSNDRSIQEDRRNFLVAGTIAPRRVRSEAWDTGDKQRAGLAEVVRRSPNDEESEALLSQLLHDFILSGKVDGAIDKLENARAFEREGEANIFARTSKSIVDTLAKHWTATRGPEILSVASTQLMEKQEKHRNYLQFLALSKCHEELCSRQRQSLQIVMEHGEKLAAMMQLREFQHTITHASASELGSYSSSVSRMPGALWGLIQLVGERARRGTVLLMDRDNAEVFYSKVSDLEDVFFCLERHLEHVIDGQIPVITQQQRACELSNACVTIFRAAMEYKSEHHLWYPPPEGLTPWYSKSVVYGGVWCLASFMLQLLKETNRLDYSAKFDFYSNLEALSEILLESYSNAVASKDERKEEHRSLLEEYWTRRDALLDSLYQHVKILVDIKLQDQHEKSEQNKDALMELSSKLFSISKRHEGYQTMWSICCDLNDSELLRSLMHESMGPKGGFSSFVFQQLYDSKQYLKLMRLGEEFQEDLTIFLKYHPDLLWLHEVFLHQFSSASETLHGLSVSKDETSVEETVAIGKKRHLTLGKRKHFLNLAKIAAAAGRSEDWELKIKCIEADLNILKLQEEVLTHLSEEEKRSIGNNLIPPIDLIELCLKIQSRELSLRVFDLFAWTSASFLKNNTSLLEECWRNAANQDDWERLHQMSANEGWSDETTLDRVKETVLFQASRRCYGPEAEASFDQVLPLRETMDSSSSSSVEGVLMQHKDFADVGKLMLTAVTLGSLDDDGMLAVGIIE